VSAIREVRFKVGFNMTTEYDVVLEDWRVIRVAVRVGAHTLINGRGNDETADGMSTWVLPTIGTVMHEANGTGASHRFPDPAIVEHFRTSYGIPLVGARWSDSWAIEYNGASPPPPVKCYPYADGKNWTWLDANWWAKLESERAERAERAA
jgi:hypothetical protein